MAAPLEHEVMSDIGLGNYPNYYSGSSSCGWIAREAARRLPDAIRKRHDAGEEIAAPDTGLCRLLTTVAQSSDTYATNLTPTWEAASYVIQAHLYAFHDTTDAARQKTFAPFEREIKAHYLPKPQQQVYDMETGLLYRQRW